MKHIGVYSNMISFSGNNPCINKWKHTNQYFINVDLNLNLWYVELI